MTEKGDGTLSKRLSTGSGASTHYFDRENKRLRIDFSGSDGEKCYRNDASILFFASNSYKSAFLSLGSDIENRFENYTMKDIEHLVLPYFFNFRHYVELELKALYVAITSHSPKITHDLRKLIRITEQAIREISFNAIDNSFLRLTEAKFDSIKSEVTVLFAKTRSMIEQYISKEPVVEYYRYIFENDKDNGDKYLVLNHSIIELDFPETNKLFCNIRDSFDILCKKLREIIYIYFTL